MDIFNLNITSISLIELLKILLKIFDLLAEKENSEFQRGNTVKNEYSVKYGENTSLFINDLYNKTVNFLRNNFREEDLLQISENIDWKKQETIKEEPPKQTPSRSHALR